MESLGVIVGSDELVERDPHRVCGGLALLMRPPIHCAHPLLAVVAEKGNARLHNLDLSLTALLLVLERRLDFLHTDRYDRIDKILEHSRLAILNSAAHAYLKRVARKLDGLSNLRVRLERLAAAEKVHAEFS
jgi:hypothetical protein